jgi:hypothetical protein
MEIKPTYVTFEQAKWLKEKGFDLSKYLRIDDENPLNLNSNYNPREYQPWYLELHQWQVVEWLRVKHGIWILVLPQDKSGIDFRIDKSKYPSHALFLSIIKYDENYSCKQLINTSDDKSELFLHFDTPQEAYSAAFNYIISNNLI